MTAGDIKFSDPVLTQDGPKPLGECRLFLDKLLYKNMEGDRFHEVAGLCVMRPDLRVAVPDESDKKEEA